MSTAANNVDQGMQVSTGSKGVTDFGGGQERTAIKLDLERSMLNQHVICAITRCTVILIGEILQGLPMSMLVLLIGSL